MSIKSDIKWLQSIHAAGFSLVNNQSLTGRDGLCWNASLAYGRTKIVVASNGGYGGPDSLDFYEDPKQPRTALVANLEKFRKLPQVHQYVQAVEIEGLDLRKELSRITEEQYAAEKAQIVAGESKIDDEAIASTIARMADITGFEKKLRRECKKKICVVTKDDVDTDSYYTHVVPDTPRNREAIKAHHKENFDFFIIDLLDGKIQGC
jgi:hypothetical protein